MGDFPQLHLHSATQQATNYWLELTYSAAAMLCWTAFAVWTEAWLKKHCLVSTTGWANRPGVGAGRAWIGVF